MPAIVRTNAWFLMRIKAQEISFRPQRFLYLNPQLDELVSMAWPTENYLALSQQIRVTPEDWHPYRVTHHFHFPCCLCARTLPKGSYTETDIHMETEGCYAGHYVAACAQNACGYIVSLDRLYPMRGLFLKRYSLCSGDEDVAAVDDTASPQLPTAAPLAASLPAGSVHSHMSHVVNLPDPSGQSLELAIMQSAPTSSIYQLLLLDAQSRPGLSAEAFHRMFTQCLCGLVMTRRELVDHTCEHITDLSTMAGDVIDLTSDMENDLIDLTMDSDDEM